MVNTERLQERLEFVTRNRSHHKQSLWFQEYPDNACQTTGCLAGWTAMHYAKDQLRATEDEVIFLGNYVKIFNYDPIGMDWEDLGAELLDLTYDQASELFHSDNSLYDLWNFAKIITEGAIQIPAEVEALKDEEWNRSEDYDYDWLTEED